jgi:hypothetical protein
MRLMRLALQIVLAPLLIIGPATSRLDAQTLTPTRPPAVTEVRSQLGASYNNAGLQEAIDASWRRALSGSTSPMLSDAHVAVGGTLAATPTGVRAGAWAELAPVSIFTLRVGMEPAQYFGTFHSLTSFDNRTDVFDPDARKARANAKAGRTMRMYVAPSVQLRAGHVAAASTLNFERWSSSVAGPLFYEPTRDTLLATSGDHLATLTTVMLYEHVRVGGGKLSAGPIHTLTRVHGKSLNQIQKIGMLVTQQSAGRHLGMTRPSLTAMVGYYVDDPHKDGQWTAAMSVGFTLRRR